MMSAYTGVIGTLRGDGGKRRGSGDAMNNYQVGSPRSITHFTLNETLSGVPHVFTQCSQRQQRTQMGARHYTCPSIRNQTTCQGSWFLFWRHRWGLMDAISL